MSQSISSKLRILAQSASTPAGRAWAHRLAAAALLMGLGMVAAFGLAPDTMLPDVPTQTIERELKLPALTPLPPVDGYWREERIQRGDTLGGILARLSVTDPAALGFLRSDTHAKPLYQLKPGKSLRVRTDDDGRLIALSYLAADGSLLAIDRIGEGLVARSVAPQAAVRIELRAGEIASSLFAAADAIGLPDAVTVQIAEVFSGEIDFHHDLRRGDRFTVVYETREVDGYSLGAGRVLAAEFVNKGLAHRAFLWHSGDGSEGYYAEDGKSLRRAFLRSPLAFSRVTSGFSLARFHPFAQAWRAHKGVDFAAPAGTPVHAAGDGQVALAGTQNGYGNVVILRHAGAYSTVYAHLSRFAAGVRTGASVAQGDVIGYVGQTGWATGPHLHYEFRVNGVERDPLTIAMPNAQPIPASERVAYLERSAPLAAQLALGRDAMLAGAE
ncbi:MAG TPA: peptidoglycan DD-metalloendopeptidase family protein [Casimicrobiaceae bacterium]|nr:peptidoglycan DD-metalloendopeptidase family protein [Casimicrobiaceae bacterium]